MPPKRDTVRPPSSADSLSDAGRDVAARWEEPCRALFDALAKHRPQDLAALVRARTLPPEDLTFAAEKLGETREPDAFNILKGLILDDATSPVVKEGALYGLHQLDAGDLTDILQVLMLSASPALRTIATKLLSRRG